MGLYFIIKELLYFLEIKSTLKLTNEMYCKGWFKKPNKMNPIVPILTFSAQYRHNPPQGLVYITKRNRRLIAIVQ